MKPEITAKEYFKAFMAGDYEKAYDLLSIDESEFINEKYFGKLVQEMGCEDVAHFEVDSVRSDSKSYAKTMRVTYRLRGETNDYTFDVNLEKSESKKFLFFDEWKVIPDRFLKKNVRIFVLKDSEVTIDDIKLGKDYLVSETVDENADEYRIPAIFTGDYQAQIKNSSFNDYKASITVSGGDENDFYEDLSRVSMKTDALQKVCKQAQADFQNMWNSAAKKEDFAKIKGVAMAKDTDELSNDYSNLVDKFINEEGVGLKKLTFQDISINANEDKTSGDSMKPVVKVEFETSYTYTSAYKDWWTGEIENQDGEGNYQGWMYYFYEDGKWVLYDTAL